MTAQPALAAADIVARLGLEPHPEGGYFRETFRDTQLLPGGRPASTAIYFLLPRGVISRWHRVDAAEGWHWYLGAPLRLSMAPDSRGPVRELQLGPGLDAGEVPQAVVPRDWWQQAESLGEYTLAGCTVAPAFSFDGFVMADKDFDPSTT